MAREALVFISCGQVTESEIKLGKGIAALKPMLFAEPHLEVQLSHVPEVTESEIHKYSLKATLTNLSNASVRSVTTRLDFPRTCLDEDASYDGEDKAAANESHRTFRSEYQLQMDPNDTKEIYPLISYEITHALYFRHTSRRSGATWRAGLSEPPHARESLRGTSSLASALWPR